MTKQTMAWMNFKNMKASERRQHTQDHIHTYTVITFGKILEKAKLLVTESRLEVVWGQTEGGDQMQRD